jgi:predicted RNA-binding protein associated with RNAse of E/G family
LLGYYCDIVTPLQKIGGDYYRTDLVLDLWVTPDLKLYELDWDEYEQVIEQGLMSIEQQEIARSTLERLKAEVATGRFPAEYIR